MNMLRPLPALVIALLVPASLLAGEPAWNPVSAPSGALYTLQYRIVSTKTIWVIEFRNLGSSAVHFNYRFPSLQNKKVGLSNGRMNLSAKTGRGQIPLPSFSSVAPAALANQPIQVFNVRCDAADQGDFQSDSN